MRHMNLPKQSDPPEVHQAYIQERIAKGDPDYVIHPDERVLRPCISGKHGELVIPLAALAALSEYSCSLPSGTYQGKRWRCSPTAHTDRFIRETQEWLVAQYVAHPKENTIGILWWWARTPISGLPHIGDLR